MACEQAVDIHRYHDDELGVPQRVVVEEHLERCEQCRELLRELTSLSSLLNNAAMVQAPADLVIQMHDCVKTARDRVVLRLAGWLTAAAAAVIVGALLTAPSSRNIATSPPSRLEMFALMPPSDARDESGNDLPPTEWMADEFDSGGNGDLR